MKTDDHEPTFSAPQASRQQEETELLSKARSGDGDAFGALIERHQKSVAGFLLTVLHDVDAAEDAAQQAFVQAYKNLPDFEGRCSFKTWVSRIALNVARSHLRWSKLRGWLSLDGGMDGERPWEDTLLPAAGGLTEMEALERKLDLERAMSHLSPREKEVTALRLEGFSLAEVASVLDVSEGTVKSTLFEATQKMRRRLS